MELSTSAETPTIEDTPINPLSGIIVVITIIFTIGVWVSKIGSSKKKGE
jgi:hypothetical protein